MLVTLEDLENLLQSLKYMQKVRDVTKICVVCGAGLRENETACYCTCDG